ncbi:T9SS type A sorting domain-containing protein [Neptunitalea lumnitzerae]|uniref:Secretion system C-terminal sorting domain-containing protein n=1 Tax=Neptunitalea lumnitzerae TaxID=2965509 RepID=A0ABQ5MKT7_9FLAO|nr:T9SS type A sorting domain-containing protein [Neptunitalea sp. Y10]GLB50023.1 hypothetical protein Y10_23910 [Neptunitalea sp. Y10]
MKKITTLLLFCILNTTYSQWTTNINSNTLVADTPVLDSQTIGTDTGLTYTIYTTGSELRVQLLDASGNTQFGANGIAVNTSAQMGSYTLTRDQAVDNTGNLFIGFTATSTYNGYINKITSTGTQLFGSNGINLGTAFDIKLLPLANGNLVVSWLDASYTSFINMYDTTGNAVWSAPISITPPGTNNYSSIGELVELSDGSFITFIHGRTTSNSINSNLWAQRYTATGTAAWNSPIQISNKYTSYNTRYEAFSIGDVAYIAYSAATNYRYDSFLQRINEDGTLPWGINGSDFRTDASVNYEMTTSIAHEDNSQYIYAIAQITDSYQSTYGEYIQKFDKDTGARLFTDNAKQIFPLDANFYIHHGKLQVVNDHPFFLLSKGYYDSASTINLAVTLLNNNGDFVWSNETEDIATSSTFKSDVYFTKNINNQSVATWFETRPSVGEIRQYAQNYVIDNTSLKTTAFEENNIHVFPNPTAEYIHVDTPYQLYSAELYDMKGRLILENNSTHINLQTVESGIYILKCRFENGHTFEQKIIKS